MKPTTKKIIVISTTINGRKNYIASQHSTSETTGKHVIHLTTDLKMLAKEFETLEKAQEFLPKINNPHMRVYSIEEETLQFTDTKEKRAYDRIA